ncbi:hypothetical protein EVAR_22668_1 [Eumeta japonica]|uniref:Secreted protein n=1 Tax=Eumeta variegata TaxID=151549 RepID=A0A4C1VL36_EUMVA|nr:hypothetical protein EVAR_22668_1 [Eumeta japonica]
MHVFAEMWSRRQAASLLPLLITGWLTGETSEALSTFGKTNTHTSNQPAHPTPPPREYLQLYFFFCVRILYTSKGLNPYKIHWCMYVCVCAHACVLQRSSQSVNLIE